MLKKVLFIFMIFLIVIIPVLAQDSKFTKEDAESYNNIAYGSYWFLIALFFIGSLITLFLIQSYFGTKHVFQMLGIIIFIGILFWLFNLPSSSLF